MIDPELQAQLRAKYNPDGSDLRRLQLRMLEMLKYIDRICRENNITYWLSSGTCLGAVRHGGFIPWDDDVDIEMLEPDYHKLLKILKEQNDSPYVVQDSATDSRYPLDFAKLRDTLSLTVDSEIIAQQYKYNGAFIDIFRLSPSSSKKIHIFCKRIRRIQIHCQRWAWDKGFMAISLSKLLRVVNNIIIALLKPIDGCCAQNRLRHYLGVDFVAPRYKEDLLPVKYVRFEDTTLPVPYNSDAYLHKLYGNYMELKIAYQHIQSATILNESEHAGKRD